MNKKKIIIIELIVVVCILIAGIAITLNPNNQTTPTNNNTSETTQVTVDSINQETSSSQEPYSARFENSQYHYNPSTDTYTKDGTGSYIYDYATGEWIDTTIPGHQHEGSTQTSLDEYISDFN